MDVGSIGLEMGAAIAIGYFGGGWVDGLIGTRPVLQWVGLALGIVAAGMAIVRVSRRYLRDADRDGDDGKGDGNAGL